MQLLACLEAEQLAVDLAACAQHDFAQHLDTFGFGPGISLKGDMLRQSLYRLLIVPVTGGIRHMTGRFLAAPERRAYSNHSNMPVAVGTIGGDYMAACSQRRDAFPPLLL